MSEKPKVLLRRLGPQPYHKTWRDMQAFVKQCDTNQRGEIWLTEHDPVFTLGSNASEHHVLAAGDIPVVPVDRGGQVTYHGPGQLMIYPLICLSTTGLTIRTLVTALEQTVIDILKAYGIDAYPRRDAPGVYVDEKKIASIGLRIKRDWSYHGMAFNINMDLEPFSRINPCGYAGLEITDAARLSGPTDVSQASVEIVPYLLRNLGYDEQPLFEPAMAQ